MISIGNISAGVIRNCFLRLKEETCTIVGNRGFGVGVWTWYLLLYNLAFILPLVLVFFIAWRGISTLQLIELSRNDVIIGKLAMAGFFLVMAGLMLSMQ